MKFELLKAKPDNKQEIMALIQDELDKAENTLKEHNIGDLKERLMNLAQVFNANSINIKNSQEIITGLNMILDSAERDAALSKEEVDEIEEVWSIANNELHFSLKRK